VHTSQWIVDKCLRGDLVRGRTVLLVVCLIYTSKLSIALKHAQTHSLAVTKSVANFVVSLGTDGRVVSQGSLSDALARDQKLSDEFEHDKELVELEQVEETIAEPIVPVLVAEQNHQEDGKLILEEEIALGSVSKSACKTSFSLRPWLILTILKICFSSATCVAVGRCYSGQ
jgi:hypothetical protein